MSPEEKISKKIAGLLAKAESTTPEEAEALVEKAQELMQRYAIDEATLAVARGHHDRKPEQITKHKFHFEGVTAKAHASLVRRVAAASGMRSVHMSSRSSSGHLNALDVDLIGFEGDVAHGEMLVTSLMVQGAAAGQAYAKALKADSPWIKGNTLRAERVSFLFGYANGIGKKLRDARERAKNQVAAERGTSSVALALVDRKKQVDGWVDSQYGRLTHARGPQVRTSSYARGSVAGQNADTGGGRLRAQGEIGR